MGNKKKKKSFNDSNAVNCSGVGKNKKSSRLDFSTDWNWSWHKCFRLLSLLTEFTSTFITSQFYFYAISALIYIIFLELAVKADKCKHYIFDLKICFNNLTLETHKIILFIFMTTNILLNEYPCFKFKQCVLGILVTWETLIK